MRSVSRTWLASILILGTVAASAAAQTPADAGKPQEAAPQLSVSAQPLLPRVGDSLALTWTATYDLAKVAVLFSANDGRTWQPWTEFAPAGARTGTITVPVGWSHFNFLYFSYSKFTILSAKERSGDTFGRFFGNPLRIRLVDPAREEVVAAELTGLSVKGPPWTLPLYLGTFLAAALFFYQKARWEETPRGEVSILFNVLCFACLLAKVTFFVAFAVYIVVGLGVGHRFRILSNRESGKYWLATFYQYFYLVVGGVAVLVLLVGLVMRVRDFLF